MRKLVRLGSLVGCVGWASIAAAAPTDFSAGALIIPMDACYQPSTPVQCNSTSTSASCTALAHPASAPWTVTEPTAADGRIYSNFYGAACPEPLGSTPPHDGVTKAYGLVYRLLQHNVKVYYVVQTDTTKKAAVNATDLTVSAAVGNPVQLLNHTPGSPLFGLPASFMTAGHTSIDYRGAPFIVSVADAPTVIALLRTDPEMSATDPRTGRGVFQDVYIHVTQTNLLQASVRAVLNQTPPKLALLGVGGAGLSNLVGYLEDAGLYSASAFATYPTIGSIFTEMNNITDFTSNGLVTGGFKLLWAPHWNWGSVSTAQRDQILSAIQTFNNQGGTVLLQCASTDAAEGSTNGGYAAGSTNGHFITTASGVTKGLVVNSTPQGSVTGAVGWPSGTAGDGFQHNPTNTAALWSEPLLQTGDFPLNYVDSAVVYDFKPAGGGVAYKAGVDRLVSIKSTANPSYNSNDIMVRLPATGAAGQVVFIGGHSFSTQDSDCGASACAGEGGTCGTGSYYIPGVASTCVNNCCNYQQKGSMVGLERLVLNSLIFLGQDPVSSEQTRSTPIVYSTGKTYLGSYVQQSMPNAAYPPWTGHFREYPAGGLSGSNVTSFSSITSNWDSYNSIKTQSSTDARNIYTATLQGGTMTELAFTTANLAAIHTACPAATSAIITQIRTGYLGGIDHSIPAVIGPSTVAGVGTRPTVAYVGALDGMLHAILVSGSVGSKSPGDELWAFIPPSQLCKTIAQTAGVDGSPSVGDAFVDTGSGLRSWRTLLAVPDGNYAGGTLDVLDITDPTTLPPKFMWEASDSFVSGPKTFVMGRAQGAAISPIITNTGVQFAYFVATDNTNGIGVGNGFNMYALDASNGSVIWRYNHTYVNDTTHNDVPGTVGVIDSAGDGGPVNSVYFGDLEGKVWNIPAAAGPVGTPSPSYDAALANGQANSVNFPIESAVVLYRDPTSSHLDVLGVTGGADWVPVTTLSYVFKYDTQSNTYSNLATLGTMTINGVLTAERAYALPTISGNQAYIITSFGQLQNAIGTSFTNTGNLLRINLGATAGVTTLATIKQGASEVAVDASGNVVAASATGITQNANSGRDVSQAVVGLQNATAKPLKVRAWLDWH